MSGMRVSWGSFMVVAGPWLGIIGVPLLAAAPAIDSGRCQRLDAILNATTMRFAHAPRDISKGPTP
jgi:hypothetical protein